eukprot:COSAG02_NODE_483_length_21396_cov_20.544801_17_plen_466_part_00
MLSGLNPWCCFSCSDRVESLPTWLRPHWPQFAAVLSQLSFGWSRRKENKLKRLIGRHVPRFARELLEVNFSAASPNLHLRFLFEALDSRSLVWFRRALQFGDRHATFPILFDWELFSSELKKYAVFSLLHFFKSGPQASLSLVPCDILKMVDYIEWLPTAGLNVGWTSIRHYASWLQTLSLVCGFGNIKDQDKAGYNLWKDNFKSNIQVVRNPRGGDLPLKPWQLRHMLRAFGSDSNFDVLMRAVMSLMWFTALRPGHFSPDSHKSNDMKHLLEWAFIIPYSASALGSSRTVMHFTIPSAKQNQKESAQDWSTATACICANFNDECSASEMADLTALCPVCALERWRRRRALLGSGPPGYSQFVFVDPRSGLPILRSRFNQILRDALELALDHLPEEERREVIKMISAKSWRSGAGTQIVTEGNAGFVAAAFLAHGQVDITQKYYHKGGDLERLQVLPALADSLR